MNASVIRLDPDLPVCWEDARTLRIGFDRARARLHGPGRGTRRLLDALRSGVRSERLPELADELGIPAAEASRTLAALSAVLLHEPIEAERDGRGGWGGRDPSGSREARPGSAPRRDSSRSGGPAPSAPLRVRLHDDGRPLLALETALTKSDCCELLNGSEPEPGCDLVVLVERFFEPLERSRRWLRAGTPHLLVRFTDGGFQVGPLVSARGGPCLACVARRAVDLDPALPALAAQLIGAPAAGESPAATEVAAAIAMSFIRRWREGDSAVHRSRVSLRVRRGRVTGSPVFEPVSSHPECACDELAGLARPPAPRASPRTGPQIRPASDRKREGARAERPPLAVPESRSASLARVNAT